MKIKVNGEWLEVSYINAEGVSYFPSEIEDVKQEKK